MSNSAWARSLNARLIAVVLSVAVPAGVALLALVALNVADARRSQAQALSATAAAVSAAIDTELARQIATAQSLAASDAVAARDWPRTAERIERLHLNGRRWIAISDDRGRTVLNTYPAAPDNRTLHTGLPRPANIAAAVRDRQTRISNLFYGTRSQRPTVAVDAPVLDGPGALVVSLVSPAETLLDIVTEAGLPPGAMLTLVDRNHRVIARSRHHARHVGALATPGMRQAMNRSPHGVTASRSLDGDPTVVAYHRSSLSGWTTMVVVPRAKIEAPLWVNAAGIVLALLAVGALSVLVVHRQASAIAREVIALRLAAGALGRGDAVEPHESRIVEFDDIHAGLVGASVELRRRNERQRLLINELNHRVKNTLATVQAIAAQTFRQGDRSLADKFEARLLALGGAHDLLTQTTWSQVDIVELVARCATPHGARLHATGPSVILLPEQAMALCMCLHELETNSLKYGSLSTPEGRVSLSWTRGEKHELSIRWRETGGPPALPPASPGFGTRLMDRLARNELGGGFDRRWGDDGLDVHGRFHLGTQSRWTAPD